MLSIISIEFHLLRIMYVIEVGLNYSAIEFTSFRRGRGDADRWECDYD